MCIIKVSYIHVIIVRNYSRRGVMCKKYQNIYYASIPVPGMCNR
jgi:hypothetical protein